MAVALLPRGRWLLIIRVLWQQAGEPPLPRPPLPLPWSRWQRLLRSRPRFVLRLWALWRLLRGRRRGFLLPHCRWLLLLLLRGSALALLPALLLLLTGCTLALLHTLLLHTGCALALLPALLLRLATLLPAHALPPLLPLLQHLCRWQLATAHLLPAVACLAQPQLAGGVPAPLHISTADATVRAAALLTLLPLALLAALLPALQHAGWRQGNVLVQVASAWAEKGWQRIR